MSITGSLTYRRSRRTHIGFSRVEEANEESKRKLRLSGDGSDNWKVIVLVFSSIISGVLCSFSTYIWRTKAALATNKTDNIGIGSILCLKGPPASTED